LGACTALDADIGRLLAHLKSAGLEDDTIIVFISDHGEMLGSHGLMTKGVCFEESIRTLAKA
jgi:arylsulfatase A-like enzyme